MSEKSDRSDSVFFPRQIADGIIQAIRLAAQQEILPHFRALQPEQIAQKSDALDLVTTADLASEALITEALSALFPDALIIGEEAVARSPGLLDNIDSAPLCFIIDPIDGTWNYANGLATFGVIVAATRFGQPIFGLLYDPLQDDYMIAEQGVEGAGFVASSGAKKSLKTSVGGALNQLNGFIHFYQVPAPKQARLAACLPHFGNMSNLRCSCHEYRLLAQGSFDFCLAGVVKPWDHAAGVLICQKAGGYVKMLDGREYSAVHKDGYLLAACNQATWNRLQELFAFLITP